MAEPPYILGGLSMLQGYFGAMLKGERRLDDPEFSKRQRRDPARLDLDVDRRAGEHLHQIAQHR